MDICRFVELVRRQAPPGAPEIREEQVRRWQAFDLLPKELELYHRATAMGLARLESELGKDMGLRGGRGHLYQIASWLWRDPRPGGENGLIEAVLNRPCFVAAAGGVAINVPDGRTAALRWRDTGAERPLGFEPDARVNVAGARPNVVMLSLIVGDRLLLPDGRELDRPTGGFYLDFMRRTFDSVNEAADYLFQRGSISLTNPRNPSLVQLVGQQAARASMEGSPMLKAVLEAQQAFLQAVEIRGRGESIALTHDWHSVIDVVMPDYSIRIMRFHSWLSYLRWEIAEDLSREQRSVALCRDCGHPLEANRSTRSVCGPIDNRNCYNRRKRQQMAASRGRRAR